MKVLEGQTLLDIAIQCLGSADAAYDIAVLNGISITDDLIPGQELTLSSVVNVDIATYYLSKNIQPATFLASQAQFIGSVVDTIITANTYLPSNLIRTLESQTIFDVAIREFGSVEAAFDFALLNEISVTDNIGAGTLLEKIAVVDKRIVNYYSNKQINPATAIIDENLPTVDEGIGYWAIEIDFIIS